MVVTAYRAVALQWCSLWCMQATQICKGYTDAPYQLSKVLYAYANARCASQLAPSISSKELSHDQEHDLRHMPNCQFSPLVFVVDIVVYISKRWHRVPLSTLYRRKGCVCVYMLFHIESPTPPHTTLRNYYTVSQAYTIVYAQPAQYTV
jgi:hypothetical protein